MYKVPCTLPPSVSPSMLTSYTTLVSYQNQESGIGANRRTCSHFTSNISPRVCVCVALCSCITRAALHND